MSFKFYRKVLPNGMTILFEKRNTPVVSIAFAVRCGGENEDSSEKGISHLIEHMLYKGTLTRNSKELSEQIERKGGDLNGFTSESITAIHCKIPSKHLNIALTVLSDMIKNSLFDAKEIEKEKSVIFDEIRLHKDNPLSYVFKKMQGNLYEKPFGIPLIGTYETLNSLTREKIFKRFNQTYQPNNMVLCVVGNADLNKIVDFAKKNFGNTKGRVPQFKISKKNKSKIEKRKGIGQANFILAYHVPTFKKKKNYSAFVLNVLMAGGLSSRLFQEIRQKRNLAYAIKGESDINKNFAYNLIYVGSKKENVEPIKKIILDEFKKVSKELGEKELAQVKEQIIGNHQISIEDSQHQMSNLLFYEMNGNAKELYDFEKNIRKVKLIDVKDLAKIKKYSFFALLPE